MIDLVEVTAMNKASSLGGMLPNAISIDICEASNSAESRNLFFASFLRRDYAYNVLRRTWALALGELHNNTEEPRSLGPSPEGTPGLTGRRLSQESFSSNDEREAITPLELPSAQQTEQQTVPPETAPPSVSLPPSYDSVMSNEDVNTEPPEESSERELPTNGPPEAIPTTPVAPKVALVQEEPPPEIARFGLPKNEKLVEAIPCDLRREPAKVSPTELEQRKRLERLGGAGVALVSKGFLPSPKPSQDSKPGPEQASNADPAPSPSTTPPGPRDNGGAAAASASPPAESPPPLDEPDWEAFTGPGTLYIFKNYLCFAPLGRLKLKGITGMHTERLSQVKSIEKATASVVIPNAILTPT